MIQYNRENTAKRIKQLRESRGWNITEMGVELNSILGFDEGGLRIMSLGGTSGKHTVAQLESLNPDNKNKRNITPDIAFAYSEIFEVSLEYIYCQTDDWQPEHKNIKEVTGLIDSSIESLTLLGDDVDDRSRLQLRNFLNDLLSSKNVYDIAREYENYKRVAFSPKREWQNLKNRIKELDENVFRELGINITKNLTESDIKRYQFSYVLDKISDFLKSIEGSVDNG